MIMERDKMARSGLHLCRLQYCCISKLYTECSDGTKSCAGGHSDPPENANQIVQSAVDQDTIFVKTSFV
jgi:hypothetical protein